MTNDFIDQNRTPFDKGYVHVYTGDGKGKTTAAIGLAVRAAGAGLLVYIGQFIKSGKYNEATFLESCTDRITICQYGRGCWLHGEPSEEDKQLAAEGLAEIGTAMLSGKYDVVILDEANVAVHFGILSTDDILALIDNKPERVELIFTGRRAPQWLIDRADLVTEMKEIKHYYQTGVIARNGIES
jgi:cob(I)alamin adenosyltransferase